MATTNGQNSGKLARWLRPRWAAFLLLAAILALPVNFSNAWLGLSDTVFDAYQRIQPRIVERLPVAIVDIDEASLKAIGQWPWPRTELANLIERAAAAGALSIGLDILMPEADRFSPAQLVARHPGLDADTRARLSALPNNDDLLAMRMFALPVIVGRAGLNNPDASLPTQPTTVEVVGPPPHGKLLRFTGHLANIPSIEAAAQGHGFLNSDPGSDGVIRAIPAVVQVGDQIYPSLSVEMLRLALGQQGVQLETGGNGVRGLHIGQSYVRLDTNGMVRLHYSLADPRRRVSAIELLEGRLDPNIFADQLVLIGATALGLRDAPPTPVSGRMDGVEIQAQMIETLLSGSRLLRPDWTKGAEVFLLLLLGGLLVLAGRDAAPWLLAALFVLPAAAVAAGSFALFSELRLLLDPVPAVLGCALILSFLLATGYSHANARRRALSRALEVERLETARMAGELGAAREIQLGILPDPRNIIGRPPNLDFFAVLEPAREVGGDLYDVFMVDDTRLFFLIGDVSGKGVGAALFMALSKALCKSAALRGQGGLAEMVSVASGEIARENPAMLFVTAVAGLFDTATGQLQFCNAGHDAPLVRGADGTVRSLEFVGGPPFCVLEDFPYPIEETQLTPGELLLLSTDGVTEAQGADNVQFGTDRIITFLEQCGRETSAEALCEGLHDKVKDFMKGAPAFDDVAILALRYLETER